MKPPALLGIYREKIFSPGKIQDDAAIMDAAVEELSRRGWEVCTRPAESIDGSLPRPENVLSMAQSDRVLNTLKDWNRQGTRVINTVPSVLNCYRKPLIHFLSKAGICIPPSRVIAVEEAEEKISLHSSDGLWLKRGDVHAIEPGDVAYVTCKEELDRALEHFFGKGIRDILVQRHVKGPAVKFYGVGRHEYFRAYLAAEGKDVTSEAGRLRTIARQAAGAVGLEVYGGDAILTEGNEPVLIDLNDWPSFSPCCRSAAVSIASYLDAETKEEGKRRAMYCQAVSKSVSRTLSAKLYEEEQLYMAPGLQEVSQLSRLAIRKAGGCRLIDMEGKSYLDFMAGVAVCSIGHSHPAYIAAISEQLNKVTVGSFTTENRVALLRLIASLTPGGLNRTQLYSGGAEAVEAAIRLAKSYNKKFEILGFWGGFHGKTGGVLGLIGDPFKKHWGTLYPGLHLAPYPDCYRCPFDSAYPGCGVFCLNFVRKIIENNTAGSLSAIIVETMQGTAGNIIPPPEFLPGLVEIAHANDALLIADEMITGFGRTGMMFGSNHTGITPDIMTIGKGMGGGFPISGLVSTDEITASKPFSKPSASSSSYGGNPLACTAALVTIRTILDESLVENAREVGDYLLKGLRGFHEQYEFIGDVRGCGLLIGVELVKNRETKRAP